MISKPALSNGDGMSTRSVMMATTGSSGSRRSANVSAAEDA